MDLKPPPPITAPEWGDWERDEWPKWAKWRSARRYERVTVDQRSEGARDRDRLLYSSALRRLAGVTQVVDVEQGHLFHNRLTHTMKVEQVGRRLAEHLMAKEHRLALAIGGIDPEVVAGAALAHDMGHPPFGHIAENELDRLLSDAHPKEDGYEGNAQTFRIVTHLAVRHEDWPGLNLTRATLNAILKYPWLRMTDGVRKEKFGAFTTEGETFHWARDGVRWRNARTVEAEIMDWADDITYSVHDVEDFYRAGLVPLDRLVREAEQSRFIDGVFKRWEKSKKPLRFAKEQLKTTFGEVMDLVPAQLRDRPYDGTTPQRAALRAYTATLIARYVMNVSLKRPESMDAKGYFEFLSIQEPHQREIAILKELTKYYVVDSPALAAQQHGQRRVIRDLFDVFRCAIQGEEHAGIEVNKALLPFSTRDYLLKATTDWEKTRVAADLVAGLTEQQALRLHRRLSGFDSDSVTNVIVY